MILDISKASYKITDSIKQLNVQTEKNSQALSVHAIETEQVVSAITQMSATSESIAEDASKTANNGNANVNSTKKLASANSQLVRKFKLQ